MQGPAEAFTIAAVATAPAAGGIGIIRISGPRAREVSRGIAPGLPVEPEPRRLLRTALTRRTGEVLDEGLAVFFPGPRSFTGEDVVELHAHGSPRLLALLERELLAHPDVRPAEPGEFTRRAVLHGRIDLTRAEGILAMVSAPSEAAVRAAAQLLTGRLAQVLEEIRAPFVALRADVEGVLNFPDESEGVELDLSPRIAALRGSLSALVNELSAGRLLGRRVRVVLFGPVNAGKSTLFNRLLGEERALVDAEPGTTRDVLEAQLELEGVGVVLMDVAGLRDQPGRIEALGIERARAALRSADLAVLVVPPDASEADVGAWRVEAGEVPVLEVGAKCDLLVDGEARMGGRSRSTGTASRVPTSGKTGAGVTELKRELHGRLRELGAAEGRIYATERQADALRRSLASVERAQAAVDVSTLEVIAGELSLGMEALGEVTGENASAAVLDAIFQRFCIGK